MQEPTDPRYDIPEILRTPLTTLYLKSKAILCATGLGESNIRKLPLQLLMDTLINSVGTGLIWHIKSRRNGRIADSDLDCSAN